MDAADIAAIDNWFSTHSRNSFIPNEDSRNERALEAAVDVPGVNRKVIDYVLAQLGDSANESQYALQFNDHIVIFHPNMNLKEAQGLIDGLENEAKTQLGL